jgi:hypothetical protein
MTVGWFLHPGHGSGFFDPSDGSEEEGGDEQGICPLVPIAPFSAGRFGVNPFSRTQRKSTSSFVRPGLSFADRSCIVGLTLRRRQIAQTGM